MDIKPIPATTPAAPVRRIDPQEEHSSEREQRQEPGAEQEHEPQHPDHSIDTYA
jgi:hypothetical protein